MRDAGTVVASVGDDDVLMVFKTSEPAYVAHVAMIRRPSISTSSIDASRRGSTLFRRHSNGLWRVFRIARNSCDPIAVSGRIRPVGSEHVVPNFVPHPRFRIAPNRTGLYIPPRT